jgi:hypothetical protein
MRRALPLLLLLAAIASLPAPVDGQQPADTVTLVEEANRKLDEWIDTTRVFVGDVRVEEADLESFLEHYEEFSTLGEEMDEEEDEGFVDYDEVLADPAYRSWAAANGLAAEPWLKRSMRIIALTMRDQMQAGFAQAEAQLPEQRRMINEQCAQVGAEMCRQMKAGLEMSMAMFEHQKARIGDLPQPAASEQALLERYAGELTALMAGGEEEWEEEEWEEEEDD